MKAYSISFEPRFRLLLSDFIYCERCVYWFSITETMEYSVVMEKERWKNYNETAKENNMQ